MADWFDEKETVAAPPADWFDGLPQDKFVNPPRQRAPDFADSAWEGIANQYLAGSANFSASLIRAPQIAGEALGFDAAPVYSMAQGFQRAVGLPEGSVVDPREVADQLEVYKQSSPKTEFSSQPLSFRTATSPQYVAENLSRTVGELAPTFLTAAATGPAAPYVFGTLGGVQASNTHYEQRRKEIAAERGISDSEARRIAAKESLGVGVLTAAIDKFGVGKARGLFKNGVLTDAGKSYARRVAEQIGAEMVREGSTELAQELSAMGIETASDVSAGYPGVGLDEFIERGMTAAYFGSLAGGALRAPTAVAGAGTGVTDATEETPRGLGDSFARYLARNRRELATQIAALESPSRKAFKELGIETGNNRAQRESFQKRVFDNLLQVERENTSAETADAATPIPSEPQTPVQQLQVPGPPSQSVPDGWDQMLRSEAKGDPELELANDWYNANVRQGFLEAQPEPVEVAPEKVDIRKGRDARFLRSVAKAFPNAEILRQGNRTYLNLNGAQIDIRLTDEAQAMPRGSLAYHFGRPVSQSEADAYQMIGSFEMLTKDGQLDDGRGLLTLWKHADGLDELAIHESVHAARAFGLLTDEEFQTLAKKYKRPETPDDAIPTIEEDIANALQSKGQDAVSRFFRKIKARIEKLFRAMGFIKKPTATEVEVLLQTPEFWQRQANPEATRARNADYAAFTQRQGRAAAQPSTERSNLDLEYIETADQAERSSNRSRSWINPESIYKFGNQRYSGDVVSQAISNLAQRRTGESDNSATYQGVSRFYLEDGTIAEQFNQARKDTRRGKSVPDWILKALQESKEQIGDNDVGDYSSRAAPAIQIRESYEVAKGKLTPITKLMKRYFTSAGDLGTEAMVLNENRKQKIRRMDKEVNQRLLDLNKAVKESYGVGMDKLSQQQLYDINAELTGNDPSAPVPSEVLAPIREIRALIDTLSSLAKDMGIVTADMQVVFDENMGKYVVRSYRIFDDKNYGYETIPPEVLENARRWYRENWPEGETPTEKDIDNAIRDFISDRADSNPFLRKMGTVGNDLSSLMERDDIPKEIRDLMGEYHDPRVNAKRSVMKLAHMVNKYEYQKQFASMGLGTFLFREDDESRPEGYNYQIAKGDNKSYGPLAGLRTSEEIGKAIEREFSPQKTEGFISAWLKLNGTVKATKTIWSVGTQLRNILANANIALRHGHLNAGELNGAFQTLVANFREEVFGRAAPEKIRQYVLKLNELGILGEEVNANELRAFIKDVHQQGDMEYLYDETKLLENFLGKKGRAADRSVKGIVKFAETLYMNGDALWKIAAFESEKKRYSHLVGSRFQTEAELESYVANIVKDTWPTYSRVPEAVKRLRTFPLVGTFVSFPAEIMRTYANTLRLAVREIKDADPKIRQVGWGRVAGSTVSLVGPALASWGSMLYFGIDEEEEEAIRTLAPEWERNLAIFFLGRDENGIPIQLDMSYLMTDQILVKPIIAIVENRDPEEALRELTDPFISMDINTKAMTEIFMNYDQDRGRPVYDVNQDKLTAAYQSAQYYWSEALEPGTVRDVRNLTDAAQGKVRGDGKVITVPQAIGRMAGVKTYSRDPKVQVEFAARTYAREEGQIESSYFTSKAKSRGSVSDRELIQGFLQMEQTRRRLFDEMADSYHAALTLTKDNSAVTNAIGNTLSQDTKRALLSRTYRPWTPSPQFIRAVPKEKREQVMQAIREARSRLDTE